MISLALELCETVHLYGFWPFSNHPYKLFPLTNHYYDNVPYNSKIHAMSDEFYYWVQLHNKGILKLHLGDCKSDQVYLPFHFLHVKENPFSKKRWDTCSVVGNGGILTNSGCGKMIDSADFVIRCNLPPLENEFKSDVGMKTNLVTANPSILTKKYGSLMARRRAFVDSLHQYGNSLLLFPCFSFGAYRAVCQRAVYAIEDMEIPIQPIFTNPQYLQSMDKFWKSQGVNGHRPSTGAYMISLALELCETVHLYGFWPFSNHPYKLFPLTNHYYDNVPYDSRVHAMPDEFYYWVQLHNKGILKLHLEDCKSGQV
uniref:ST8 alpha-N-acetyl-neuraminide alpha-2,8-sialyltransferase 6 n=1 Tax=Haplochromis burtoni TaxID=8153 RepID=A0A3Q2XHI8_HAPBU